MEITRQNSAWSVERLRAEETFRRKSLRMQSIRTGLATLIAVTTPIANAIDSAGRPYLAMAGAIIAMMSVFVFEVREGSYRKASVQCKEQFDSALFEIQPVEVKDERILPEEEICAAATEADRSAASLHNWYPDPGNLEHGFAVLLCQRASLVWDIRLRHRYATVSLTFVSFWFSLGMLISVIVDISLREYVLTWIVPSTALLIIGLQSAIVNREIANRRERLLGLLLSTWYAAEEQKRDVSTAELRGLQEAIFQIRNDSPVLPLLFSRRYKDSFYTHMSEASERLKNRAGRP